MPSPPLASTVLLRRLTCTRPFRSMPSSVLWSNTSSVQVPLESLPKSTPSSFAVIRLCEMSTRELPRTPSTPLVIVSPVTALPAAWEPNSSTALPAQPDAPPHTLAV